MVAGNAESGQRAIHKEQPVQFSTISRGISVRSGDVFLMALEPAIEKAYNREPEMCWECFNCVKICPTQAIEVRGYADFVPMGASVIPLRSDDSILWTVKFRDGMLKRFKFRIRTNEEGTVQPDGGFGVGANELKGPTLFTEPASLGLPAVQTIDK